MKRALLFIYFLLFFIGNVLAQNVVFTAEASATLIGIEDEVFVRFSIENSNEISKLQQPSFPGFQVLAPPERSEMTEYRQSGNQMTGTTKVSFTFTLKPVKTGILTIPALVANGVNGRIYQSNAVTIKVENGSLAPQRPRGNTQNPDDIMAQIDALMQQQDKMMQQMMQQNRAPAQMIQQNPQSFPEVTEKEMGSNLFLRVQVDKTKVNVGEQITATYKMYTRVKMQAGLSKPPSLNGFWTQDFDLPDGNKPKEEILNGVLYNTFILKKSALFPQQIGTLLLDATEIKGVALLEDRNVQFKLKSEPLKITVTPLPIEGQPENFSGAVGAYSLKSSLDKTTLSTDESLNLTINISGSGNLKLIGAPTFTLPNGIDIFDPIITDTITGRTTTISGNKIFKYPISPRIAGDYTIPAIPFSFYNSSTKSYTTLYTQPVKIHVTQGKNDTKKDNNSTTLNDVHGIDTKTFQALHSTSPLLFSYGYWSLYLLPLLSLITFAVWKKRSEKEKDNAEFFKKKYANKIALKRLNDAKILLDKKQTVPFYEEISKAIWLYLSDKLHIPLSLLSKETAIESLTEKNVSEDLLQKINHIIDDCELALYAPTGAAKQMNNTYTETIQLIGKLEEILKK